MLIILNCMSQNPFYESLKLYYLDICIKLKQMQSTLVRAILKIRSRQFLCKQKYEVSETDKSLKAICPCPVIPCPCPKTLSLFHVALLGTKGHSGITLEAEQSQLSLPFLICGRNASPGRRENKQHEMKVINWFLSSVFFSPKCLSFKGSLLPSSSHPVLCGLQFLHPLYWVCICITQPETPWHCSAGF